ncbi:MAG: YhfC family glutamic-type intramembrane protease [Anaerolineales bacterium]|jgi:uncharacterized membrane protein YhfC
MLAIVHVLNFSLMIGLPLALGVWLTRRFRLSWGLFGWGALTFIASQALHIPFNQLILVPWIVGLGFPDEVLGLIIGSLLVGLSAGVFEELARYVFLQRWAREARSWRSGLLYGAGHGGVEAMIFGGLAMFSFIQAMVLRNADLAQVLEPGEIALAQQQLEAYWGMSPGLALLGAIERVFALLVQMSAALMVVISVVRSDRWWLIAAIAWHTIVDGAAVYLMQRFDIYVAEGAVFVMAVAALGFIFWVRQTGLLPEDNGDDSNGSTLRSGSSRLPNHGIQDRIGEDMDRSRYV